MEFDEIIPDEICKILEEAGFSKQRKHSRWNYTFAFVVEGADTFRESLTRDDVEQLLERHFDDLKFENTRSTSNNALNDLVGVEVLEVENKGNTDLYWLTHSLNIADSKISETTSDTSAGTVPLTESESSSPSTSSAEPTATHSSADVARGSYLQFRGMVSLFALVAGLFLTIVALILLRLPVVTAPWLESAVLGWALISLGTAASVVTVSQWVRRNLGTLLDIEST